LRTLLAEAHRQNIKPPFPTGTLEKLQQAAILLAPETRVETIRDYARSVMKILEVEEQTGKKVEI
jgi:hypothetical protein